MEKLPLSNPHEIHPSHPGLPEGLVVGMAHHQRRHRLLRGVQALLLLISCLTVANLGVKTVREYLESRQHPHHHHHHFHHDHDLDGHHHPWLGAKVAGGDEPPHHKGPPKPLACYPLAPGEKVNVTLKLAPGNGPPGISPPPGSPPPPPPHIYLHPSLFSSDVTLIRQGEANKTRLGKSPGGPEGITVFATFARGEKSRVEEETKEVEICTHRAPNGAFVGAFFPPPVASSDEVEDSSESILTEEGDKKKKKKGKRPFPPHPKDQFPDISAQIFLPSGLGIHLDSLPPPPPPPDHPHDHDGEVHAHHHHHHHDDDGVRKKKKMGKDRRA